MRNSVQIFCRELQIKNFRGVQKARCLFKRHNLISGGCNSGKTALIEAIAHCLGANQFVPVEIEDFHRRKAAKVGTWAEPDIHFSLVITGFETEDPKDYPEWFQRYRAKALFWDTEENCLLDERPKEGNRYLLAVDLHLHISLKEGRVDFFRYFFSEEEGDLLPKENEFCLPASFFEPYGVFYFPLSCLSWLEEFEEAKKDLEKRSESWVKEQKEVLSEINDVVKEGNGFFQKALKVQNFSSLSDSEKDVWQNQAFDHFIQYIQSIEKVSKSLEEPEKMSEELARVLPWFDISPEKEEKIFQENPDPSYVDLLEFLVQKSQMLGTKKIFAELVERLKTREIKKLPHTVIFDEVEHYFPKEVRKKFVQNLFSRAHQSFFVTHDLSLTEVLKEGEDQAIDILNEEGELSFCPAFEKACLA